MTELPPPQPGSNFGYQAGRSISEVAAGASAYAGYKAGQNYHDLTGDLKEAAWRGAIAGRRWFIWTLGCVAWCVMVLITFCIYMGSVVDRQDAQRYGSSEYSQAAIAESTGGFHAWLLSLPIVLVFLLVIYKRNIDFGLHRRKPIYDLAKAISPIFAWAPNFLLYAGFVIVPVTLQLVLV